MKRHLLFVASSFALCVCACSSSSSSPGSTSTGGDGGAGSGDDGGASTTCTATASGGTTGTLPCAVGAAFISGETTMQIASPDQSDGVSIIIELNGPPTATTYTAATVVSSLGDFKSTDKTTEWEEQAASGADTEGTFTMTITDVGATLNQGAGNTGYQNLHGTFTGTFLQRAIGNSGGDAGSGTANLSVTF